jgi:hypothetical protein
MGTSIAIESDRVREATAERINDRIDRKTAENIRYYASAGPLAIRTRIEELDKEWDIERILELNASLLALSGVILGATVNKKWLILSAMVTGFLAWHAVQGWCPPVPVLRRLGVRTQKEIDSERHALEEFLEKKN